MPLCWLDREGSFVYANNAFLSFTGYDFAYLRAMQVGNLAETDSTLAWWEAFDQIHEGKLSHRYVRLINKDGSKLGVQALYQKLEADGQALVCLTLLDLSLISGQLHDNVLLRQAVDGALVGVIICEAEGNIIYANQSANRLLGYQTGELLGVNVTDFDRSPYPRSLPELTTSDAYGRRHAVFETLHQRKDGSIYPAEVTINMDQSWYQKFLICFFRDITTKQQQENQLKQFRSLIDKANDALYIYDQNRRIIYVNEAACGMTGYSRDELLEMSVAEIDPEHPGRSPDEFLKLAHLGEKQIFETVHKRKDGSRVEVEVSLAVNLFEGRVYNSAFVRDITERNRIMEESRELRFALENAMDAVYLYDRLGRIHYVNNVACNLLGYTREELLQKTIADLDSSFSESDNRTHWSPDQGNNRTTKISSHTRKDGTTFPVEIIGSSVTSQDKQYAVVFVRDITERLKVQQALQEGEQRFKMIADTSPVALVISRVSDGRILYANKQAEVFFEKSAESLLNHTVLQLLGENGLDQEVIDLIAAGKEVRNREIMLTYYNDLTAWVSLNAKSIELDGEKVVCCALLDVTEAKELSNQLTYQATYDDLTGLVNRREFEDRLQEVIEIARERKSQNALCYLDLDQFKIINDTCGHMAGDEMLRQLAHLLSRCVRRDDTLARLGGDEFAILLENCPLENAEQIANNIRQLIQDFRFSWHDNTFTIGVSIGLVPISTEAESISDVMRRADTACYAAKDSGRNRIHVFRLDDEEMALRHGEMQWVSRINVALDNNRFELWQQRIEPVRPTDKTGNHIELLLRMQDEKGNLVSPGSFLPAAERYDLGARIDKWVIRRAFKWFKENPEALDRLSLCAINISGQSFSDVDFLHEVTSLFRRTGIPPSKICFEITETAAIAKLTFATSFMKSLTSLGCTFALDDFGSGLSSFAYLKSLPVDYVKIDGFFVKDILSDPVDLAMVKAINDMAHAMGKLTIAEFVEDEDILAKLVELGVDYVQGYGIARPEPLLAGKV